MKGDWKGVGRIMILYGKGGERVSERLDRLCKVSKSEQKVARRGKGPTLLPKHGLDISLTG
jgi:hypothetical protein